MISSLTHYRQDIFQKPRSKTEKENHEIGGRGEKGI